MLPKVSLLLLSCVLLSAYASGHQELDNLLMQQQKDLQLSSPEVETLRPLYRELQSQHDYLYSLKLQQGDGSAQSEAGTEPQMDASYLQVFEEFRSQFAIYVDEKPKIVYDTSLPTVEELIGKPGPDLTKEQQAEFKDLRDILQDVIDEAQEGIDDLVMRAIDLETNLLTINKPKIVTAAIGGLGFMSNYSHVPQFQQALQAVSDGVDCYTYTTGLVLRIQHETVASVKEIRQSIRGLVNIYKKIAAKQTTMGRILSGTINALSAIRRVHDIIAVGIEGYGKLNNELPGAALKSAQCGVEFVNSIPQMIETAQNLTACIVYVDTDKPSYEFTLPEEDRYWNTGAEPPEIPHENNVDEDDEDEDLDNVDDYVDHR
ncbi:GL23425 [Drosophila persimilis]|uniref:GL23425 n=1 Tax=Drosophila persimilis TaxID=7234 RepID=B4G3S3_DROPE|nr:GL23425 [Drosophila persimilis]